MNILKKIVFLAAISVSVFANALDFPWLAFSLTDGTELSVAADGLNINYLDGTLVLQSATVDRTIPTSQIKSMRFATTSSISDVAADAFSANADYFDLSGKKAGTFDSADAAREALPSGAYIVKGKNKTVKVIF